MTKVNTTHELQQGSFTLKTFIFLSIDKIYLDKNYNQSYARSGNTESESKIKILSFDSCKFHPLSEVETHFLVILRIHKQD